MDDGGWRWTTITMEKENDGPSKNGGPSKKRWTIKQNTDPFFSSNAIIHHAIPIKPRPKPSTITPSPSPSNARHQPYSIPYLTSMKSSRRKGIERPEPFLLLDNYNLLSIRDRADWTRAKNVLKFTRSQIPELANFFAFSTRSLSTGRPLPLLTQSSCHSESFRKSVKYKSILFWNSLPDTWDINKLRDSKFRDLVYKFLVSSG